MHFEMEAMFITKYMKFAFLKGKDEWKSKCNASILALINYISLN